MMNLDDAVMAVLKDGVLLDHENVEIAKAMLERFDEKEEVGLSELIDGAARSYPLERVFEGEQLIDPQFALVRTRIDRYLDQ